MKAILRPLRLLLGFRLADDRQEGVIRSAKTQTEKRRQHLVMTTCREIVVVGAIVLFGSARAQTPTGEAIKTVHISGRLVSLDGNPVSFHLRVARIAPDGFKDEGTAIAGRDGRFSFMAAPGRKYRISLAAGGMKTPLKMVDTSSGKDIDVGEMVFEYWPPTTTHIPKTADYTRTHRRLETGADCHRTKGSGQPLSACC